VSRENVVYVQTAVTFLRGKPASHTERLLFQMLFPETVPTDMQNRPASCCVKKPH
jgi:hypothetical protein